MHDKFFLFSVETKCTRVYVPNGTVCLLRIRTELFLVALKVGFNGIYKYLLNANMPLSFT